MVHSTQSRAKVGRILALGLLLAALVVAPLALAAKPAHAATTFTVNSTSDRSDLDFPGGVFDGSLDGKCFTGSVLVVQGEECTLRAAIQEANKTPGADVINFDIPGTGVNTIAPTSELPAVTGPVTINGYSQPGAQPNTKAVGSDAVMKIMLSGAKTVNADALEIGASGSTVKGFVINQWQGVGIRVVGSGATGNRISGTYIGTDPDGAGAYQGNSRGVYVPEGSNNTIGGATPAARNVISNNFENGVSIDSDATGTRVLGNYIGTDASGTQDFGNGRNGVNIEGSSGTVIGGTTAGERNVISGNQYDGVGIYASGVRVTGNYIGTDASGTKDLGNDENGVSIDGGQNNTVGGTTAGERNVISGNDYAGVAISGSGGNRVLGNYIGTAGNGTAPLGNSDEGVFIGRSPNNTVGGTTAGARNVISANQADGVLIFDASGNRVTGNYVGTDASGTQDLGNAGEGIYVSGAANTTIGGVTAGTRNVISGNTSDGVAIYGIGGNRVVGNYIGTDASGTRAVGNDDNGVRIDRAPDNVVGGTTAGERNVISGNFVGVLVEGAAATGNRVEGNYVGTDKNGTAPLGNYHGVLVTGASGNTIGGTGAGARNVISASKVYGVGVFGDTAAGNRVLSNSIFANIGLGTDLLAGGNIGSTPNDSGDIDTGPNGVQNFPVLSSAKKGATGTTTVKGTLDSTSGKTFQVQFFSNPSGTDEGKMLLGSKSVSTDGTGTVSIAFSTKKVIRLGQNITATATGPGGDTSEFSAPRKVVAP